MTFVDWLQVTSALAAIRHHIREASGGKLGGNGLLHHDPVHDAFVRHHVHSLLPLENEQRTRVHHVPVVLCFRGGVSDVRIRNHSVPRLEFGLEK